MVMVMETPSPQCVGKEFVRQYYTMLNQSPLYLHRFYSSNSSFVHGGIDQHGKEADPVVGQYEIHKKIMELDFRDCHTKIRQVDSHATMGNGVVVQVTGELSNNGQPMRRFMQTFVLAPQSPKRYYVHNDIFRYQDEVFLEDDDEDMQERAHESEPEEDQPEVADTPDVIQDHEVSPYFEQQPVSNGNAHMEEIASPVASPPIQPSPAPIIHQQMSPPPQPSLVEPTIAELEKLEGQSSSDNEMTYDDKPQSKSPEPSEDMSSSHHYQSQPPDSPPNEPKTYANMVSKNTSSGSSGSNSSSSAPSWHTASSSNKTTPTPPVTNHVPHTMSQPPRMENKPDVGFVSPQNSAPQPQRMQRMRGSGTRGGGGREGAFSFGSRNQGGGGMMRPPDDGADGDRRRSTSLYPDTVQVFVGNLPLSITENELKEHFTKYGNVVDLRINNKPNPKQGNAGRVPNFGFIVFEDEASVKRALDDKPIMFQGNHRLNVEEKKAKPRDPQRLGGGDGRPNSGRGGGMGRMGMGIGRGGGRGGPGGMNRSDNPRGGGGNMGNRGGFGGPGLRR